MRSNRPARVHTRALLASVLALVMGATMIVTPGAHADETGGPTPSDFCTTWDAIEAAHASGQGDVTVPLSNGTVVSAAQATLVGASCTAADAGITMSEAELSDGATRRIEEGLSQAAGAGEPGSGELGADSEVLKGIQIGWLNLSWNPFTGIKIWGGIRLIFTGTTVTLTFIGHFLNNDNWSVEAGSEPGGTNLPVITGTPVYFRGTLGKQDGAAFVNLDADAGLMGFGDAQISDFLLHVGMAGEPAEVDIVARATITTPKLKVLADMRYAQVGPEIQFDVEAGVALGTAGNLTLVASGFLDAAGNYAFNGTGDVSLGAYTAIGFNLAAAGSPGTANVTGAGSLVVKDLSIPVNGSLTLNPNGEMAFNLTGWATYRIFKSYLSLARFNLSGSKSTAQLTAAFYIKIFGIFGVGLTAYMQPDGVLTRVHIAGGWFMGIIFGNYIRGQCGGCKITF